VRRAVPHGGKVRRVAALVCGVLAIVLAAPAVAPAADQPDASGTEFWVALPNDTVAVGGTTTLFLAADAATTGTVSIPRLSFADTFAVAAGAITAVTVPNAARLVAAGIGPAVHVIAGKDVTIVGLMDSDVASDGFLGLPVDALGTRYTVMAWGSGDPFASPSSQFAVAAARDNTTVTVIPAATTADGHPAGVAYTVALDTGDAYLARAAVVQTDLTGSIVTSDEPVAVLGGHGCALVPDPTVFSCNPIVEQQPPDDAWGTSFVTVPLKTRVGGDTFRILASQDDTNVTIDGAAVATLQAGESHTQLIAGSSVTSAGKPVLVAQFSNGTTFDNVGRADPSMMLIPPVEQFQASYRLPTPTGFTANELNLVVPSPSAGAIKIDGDAVPSAAYTPIGSSGFSSAQVDVAAGTHALTGTGARFGVFSYGFRRADAYSFPGGLAVNAIWGIAAIALTPGDQSPAVGGEGCVTALVTAADGHPMPRVAVAFTVTGANGASGSATTGSDGRATFCYRGANAGTDAIVATAGTVAGRAAKRWIVPASTPATVPPPPPRPPRATPPAARRGSLRLTNTADARSVRAGRRITFHLTVTNTSRVAVRKVRVCDRLPAALVYVFSSPDARLDKGRRCWSVGTLRAGKSRVLKIITRALRGASGRRTNTATASGTGATARAASARVDVLGVATSGGGVTG
jgi:uncharacterized repeat protein (TIGR01451 family)